MTAQLVPRMGLNLKTFYGEDSPLEYTNSGKVPFASSCVLRGGRVIFFPRFKGTKVRVPTRAVGS